MSLSSWGIGFAFRWCSGAQWITNNWRLGKPRMFIAERIQACSLYEVSRFHLRRFAVPERFLVLCKRAFKRGHVGLYLLKRISQWQRRF